MKRSLTCLKCHSRKLWHVPIVRVKGTEMLFTFELFSCDACGYSEWYARKPEDTPEGEGLKTRILEGEPVPEGPYR